MGVLQHATMVVRHGRVFLWQMIELAKQVQKYHHFVHLNREFGSNLQWWRTFLPSWNGISFLPPAQEEAPAVTVYSDASGCWGCGAWCQPTACWFQGAWPTTRPKTCCSYSWPSPGLALRQLETSVNQYLGWEIAKSTHKTYNSGQQQCLRFCQQTGLEPLPPLNTSSCCSQCFWPLGTEN